MAIIINFRVWLPLCILLAFGDFFLSIDDFLHVSSYFDLPKKKKHKAVKFLFNNMNLNVMSHTHFRMYNLNM